MPTCTQTSSFLRLPQLSPVASALTRTRVRDPVLVAFISILLPTLCIRCDNELALLSWIVTNLLFDSILICLVGVLFLPCSLRHAVA